MLSDTCYHLTILTHSDFLFLPLTFRIISQTFLTGVLEFNLFTYCRHGVRLASLIVLRALARSSLVCIRFSRDGFLLNFRNADLRLLIAVLHSSFNHGLRLFDLVKNFGIHFSKMSCNAEVNADISSAVLNFSDVSCS